MRGTGNIWKPKESRGHCSPSITGPLGKREGRWDGIREVLQELLHSVSHLPQCQAAEVISCGFLQFLWLLDFLASLAALLDLPFTQPSPRFGSTCIKSTPDCNACSAFCFPGWMPPSRDHLQIWNTYKWFLSMGRDAWALRREMPIKTAS